MPELPRGPQRSVLGFNFVADAAAIRLTLAML
jgi:hypothetical protein